jgi:hypothetical protein
MHLGCRLAMRLRLRLRLMLVVQQLPSMYVARRVDPNFFLPCLFWPDRVGPYRLRGRRRGEKDARNAFRGAVRRAPWAARPPFTRLVGISAGECSVSHRIESMDRLDRLDGE